MRNWQMAMGGGATALLLAGCGGGGYADESAETITGDAEKEMKALSSVSMNGELTNDGQKLSLDMSVTTSGDCEGTIGLDQGTAQLLSVDGQSWMKPDEGFWQSFAGDQAAAVMQAVGDRWVVMPEEEGGFTDLCDLDSLLEEMGEDDGDKMEVGETEDVDGQEAVMIDTESDEGDPLTVWVAVDDPHYVLKMQVTEGDEPGTITFSDFDEELDVEAPSADEAVDLNQLGG